MFRTHQVINIVLIIMAIFCSLLFGASVFADAGINPQFNYQGRLTNASGANVSDGAYNFIFNLYTAPSGGSAIWTETWSTATRFSSTVTGTPPISGGTSVTYVHDATESYLAIGDVLYNTTANDEVIIESFDAGANTITISPTSKAWSSSDAITTRVYIRSGLFSSRLGSITSLSSINLNQTPLYLGVAVGADSEMTPRKRITSVLQAFQANKLDGYLTSTSTTAASEYGSTLTVADTGIVTTGTDATYGLNISATRTGATGGTINTYGIYSAVTGDAGGTSTAVGGYFSATGADNNYGLIVANGNVGIGTTAPDHKLRINDSDTTAGRAGLYVAQTGVISGTGYGGYFTKTGAGTTNVGLYASASTATNNYGLIVENGDVGIGTTQPGSSLDVAKDAGNTGIQEIRIAQLYDVGDGYTRLRAYQNSGGFAFSGNWAQGTSSSPTGDYIGTRDFTTNAAGQFSLMLDGTAASSHFDFAGAQNNTIASLMRIQLDGLVGIGTTSPNNRLEVLSATTPQLRVAYDTSNYATIAVASNGATTFDATGAGAAFSFSDAASFPAGATITCTDCITDANVVNTITASNYLPLAGGTLTGNLLFSTDSAHDIGASGATRPGTGYFGTSVVVGSTTTITTNAVNFSSAATMSLANVTNALNIDTNTLVVDASNNRVGIGTLAPNELLTVNGTISVQELSSSPSATSGYGKIYALSTAAVGNDSYTKLLLHADVTGTLFTDSSASAHSITAVGNATQSATQSKFGGKSAYFDGSGDYLSLADSDDWYFGSGNFTIDTWVNFNSIVAYQEFFTQAIGGGPYGDDYFKWDYYNGQIRFNAEHSHIQDGSYSYTFSFSTGTWYHLAIARNGSNLLLFVNGDLKTWTENIPISTLPNYTTLFNIGNAINGYLDEFRVSKGIARWTANFTPPDAPYSNRDLFYKTGDGQEINLSSGDGVWIDDGTTIRLSTNTDNVGIGLNTPSHKLQITDTDTTAGRAGFYVAQTGVITGTGYGGYFTKTGGSTTNVGLYASASGATNNYAAIFENGSVGIGTTTPLLKLDVAGSGRFTGAATTVLTGSINPTASVTVTGVGTLFTTELVIGDRITVTGETRTVTAIASNTSLTVNSAFSDNADDTSPDKLAAIFVARDSSSAMKMVVDDLGNMGIGTANPGAKLELHSNSGTGIGLLIHQAGVRYYDIKLKPSDDKLYITDRSAGVDRLVIDNTGNVGIGTTAPSAHLQIGDDVIIDNHASLAATVSRNLRYNTGSSTSWSYVRGTSDEGVGINMTGSGNMNFMTALAGTGDATIKNVMTILNDGNVGIGTTTPGAVDNVFSNVLELGIGAKARPIFRITSASQSFIMGIDDASPTKLQIGPTSGSDFLPRNSANGITIDSTGNVGIGTMSPGAFLDVEAPTSGGTAAIGPSATATGSRAIALGYGASVSGNDAVSIGSNFTVSGTNSVGIALANMTSTTLSAANTLSIMGGSVGIGTTSPAQKLHVKGSGAQYLVLEGTGDADVLSRYTNGTYDMYSGLLGAASGGPGKWGVHIGGAKMTIDSAGNVWIGGALTQGSDLALKTDVADMSKYGLDTVLKMRPVEYRMKSSDMELVGFIAQDMELVVPEVVSGSDGQKGISYGQITSILTKAIQELNSQAVKFDSNGNVGIGTTGPESRVQITGGGLCVGSDANCNTDNNLEGTVYASTTAMTVYDVAENYPTKDITLEAGDIISLDSAHNGPFVKRAEPGEIILGAISTEPAVLLGGFNGQQYKDEHQVAVALSGRILIKVLLEGGEIKQGDKITSSSLAGVGMRATEEGPTVGIALESFSEISQKDETGVGKILVFVNLGWNHLDSSAVAAASSLSEITSSTAEGTLSVPEGGSPLNDNSYWLVNSSGRLTSTVDLDLGGKSIYNIGALFGASGKWKLDESGKLIIEDIEVSKIKVKEQIIMIDKNTGENYCISIKDGEWLKEKCDIETQQTTGEPPAAQEETGNQQQTTEPQSEEPSVEADLPNEDNSLIDTNNSSSDADLAASLPSEPATDLPSEDNSLINTNIEPIDTNNSSTDADLAASLPSEPAAEPTP